MQLMARKDTYINNDVLSLMCEFAVSTHISLHEIEETYIGPKIHPLLGKDIHIENRPHFDNVLVATGPKSHHSLGKDIHIENRPHFDNVLVASVGGLKCDLESLYTEGINCDVNLRIESEVFPGHKAILSARSPVFRAMFAHDMKENISGFVDIEDMDSMTLRLMLTYMYTDSLESLTMGNVQNLYIAADRYELSSLKSCAPLTC
ncbi:speckle-type POZ protein-like B [Caerostris extrusa]|uniref:Speckle-type POZ protein-like B n=1 Tax=Caerostris extrusa TaxID=172846 RepID=A0AAV4MUE4_CAEEX|nr:speckle-type POZ protein-like B [Caerostris extrusa]